MKIFLSTFLLSLAGYLSNADCANLQNNSLYDPSLDITSVEAMEKSLIIKLTGILKTPVKLIELKPYQKYTLDSKLSIAWQGIPENNRIEIPRFAGTQDRLFSKFQIIDSKSRQRAGKSHYVNDLSSVSLRNFDFLRPASIKGLQVQDVEDAVLLGVKHAAINISVSSIINWSTGTPSETWEVDGENIPINTKYISRLDTTCKNLTAAGIDITGILLNHVPDSPNPQNYLIHPKTDLANAPNHLGAFNTATDPGLRYYHAVIEYLANRYSDPTGKFGWVSGYIIGNEVQSHLEWYNIGKITLSDFVEDYGIALRIADLAARKFHSKIRIYVSLDHHWSTALRPDPLTAFNGKEFVEQLTIWSKNSGDFPWHIAFHPYPENLFEPRFWNDRMAVLSFDTPKITFKNIEVLPAFLNQDILLYRGQPRRIILSEQGFHTPAGIDGEKVQAAAYAYAFHKLSHLPGIDAFILHRHVDHKGEGNLRLGLWTWTENDPNASKPDKKKYIYDVFRLADTAQRESVFEFAKPIIGIKDWAETLPVLSTSTYTKLSWNPVPEETESVVINLTDNINNAVLTNCLSWRSEVVLYNETLKKSIFHHPKELADSDATFTIKLPVLKSGKKLSFVFGTGLTHESVDGARFSVLIDGKELWDVSDKNTVINEYKIDLTPWAGKTVLLTLRVNPLENTQYDWLVWVYPLIITEK